MQIIVVRDPYPAYDEPQYLKEAYIGLRFVPTLIFEPGWDKKYPEGAYMVSVVDVLRVMETHSPEAFSFLAARWRMVHLVSKDQGPGFLLPFSFNCCETVQ
jgi:hypothetical protein